MKFPISDTVAIQHLKCSSLRILSYFGLCAVSFPGNVLSSCHSFLLFPQNLAHAPSGNCWNLPCFLLGGTRMIFWAITLHKFASLHLLPLTIMIVCEYVSLLKVWVWVAWVFLGSNTADHTAFRNLPFNLFSALSPTMLRFHLLVPPNQVKLVQAFLELQVTVGPLARTRIGKLFPREVTVNFNVPTTVPLCCSVVPVPRQEMLSSVRN